MKSLHIRILGFVCVALLVLALGIVVLNNVQAQSGFDRPSVQGTVRAMFPKKDAAELSRQASMIVTGEIREVLPAEQGVPPYTESQKEHMRSQGISEEGIADAWASDNEEVRTPVVMEVDSVLKGEETSGSIIRFTTLGGTAEGVELKAEGYPKFKFGEKVLIYFQGSLQAGTLDPIGVYRIKGMRAKSHDLGLVGDTDVESLKATIREHKGEKSQLIGRRKDSSSQ